MLNRRVSEGYLTSDQPKVTLDDLKSMEWVIDRYAGLVKRIAHHLKARMPAHVSVDDMIQSGMIGLLEAASKFEDTKGASFETYAGIRIRGAMLDEMRRSDWAPRSVYKNARRVADAIKQVENRTGRDARDSEIASEMGVDTQEYYSMLKDLSATRLFSISELVGAEEGLPSDSDGSGVSEPLGEIEQGALRGALAVAIEGLPEREKWVLSLYYDEELNLREIGEIIGVSESRVSQIHSQAAHRLRARMANWSSGE